jgi:hypothetical protein
MTASTSKTAAKIYEQPQFFIVLSWEIVFFISSYSFWLISPRAYRLFKMSSADSVGNCWAFLPEKLQPDMQENLLIMKMQPIIMMNMKIGKIHQ